MRQVRLDGNVSLGFDGGDLCLLDGDPLVDKILDTKFFLQAVARFFLTVSSNLLAAGLPRPMRSKSSA